MPVKKRKQKHVRKQGLPLLPGETEYCPPLSSWGKIMKRIDRYFPPGCVAPEPPDVVGAARPFVNRRAKGRKV